MEIKGIGNWASIKPQVIAWNSEIGKRMGQLGLAKRILTAADDPSGQARSARLNAHGDSVETGRRSARSGIGMARAAGGALDRLSTTLGRMGELATRAANGALSDADRTSLDAEFQGLADDLQDLVGDAVFGGVALLSGQTLELQVGPGVADKLPVELPGPAAELGLDDVSEASIETLPGALDGKQAVDLASEAVLAAQAGLGSTEAALKSAASSSAEALESIRRVERYLADTDLAEASAGLLSAQLRLQAATAAVAHHGLDADMVAKLLAA